MSRADQGEGRAQGWVSAAYARSLLDHLRGRGIEPRQLYGEALVAEFECPEGRSQIPLQRWLGAIEQAIAVTGDNALPLRVGMDMQPAHLGLLAYVLMSCATLAEVATQLERYSRLVGDISYARLRLAGERFELVWEWAHPSPAPVAMAQLQLAARARFTRWLTGREDFTAQAHFPFPAPADRALYDDFFGEPCLFDQPETKLLCPAEYLSAPIATADPAMQRLLAEQAEAALRALAGGDDFLRELERVLLQGLAVGRATLPDAAQALQTTARTLQRRLAEHGRAFRELLDELRRLQAERYLRDFQLSLGQIAFMLGYSEQSSFHNAFKRWTGTTPTAFRRACGTRPY